MLLSETVTKIVPQDAEARKKAEDHIRKLTMPRGALGRVLELAVDLAGITGNVKIPVARKHILLMAGDHGVVAEGVTPQPQSVTRQMISNFIAGGGGINVLSRNAGAHVSVVDVGVNADLSELTAQGAIIGRKIDFGTRNMAHGPAMTQEQAVRALETGIELVRQMAPSTDVFGIGEMGIGNTTPSSAIAAVFTGEPDPIGLVDMGANLPRERFRHKADVIKQAIALNRPDPDDAIDVLSKVGGYEIGAMAGVLLGAAAMRKPVMLDGFIAGAAALIAWKLAPLSVESMIAAHGSMERGHGKMLALLGKKPLLNLDLRLGEGTGAALAMNLLDAAHAVMNEMATFDSAGVTDEGL